MQYRSVDEGDRVQFTRSYGLGTEPVPVEAYISREWFEKERDKVFMRSWLCVGRAENVPKASSYFIRDIAIIRASILVVRDGSGKIQAYHNVCKHRGNKLVQCPAGKASSFTCGFHGWVYDQHGRLVDVPDEKLFFDLDKQKLGLTPIATDIWNGFIFISLQPLRSLAEEVAELSPLVEGYDFAIPVVGSYCAEVKGNWKVFLDAFQESYHVVALHQTTVAGTFSSKKNPYSHLTSARLLGRNRSISVYANAEHRMRPSEKLAFDLGVASTYTPDVTAERTPLPGLNPEQDSDWAFDINIAFPNMELLMGVGWYAQMLFWPTAEDHTHYEVRIYMQAPRDAGDAISQEFNRAMLYDVLLEDLYTIENTQSVLGSGATTHLHFSDHEIACRHNHEVIREMIGA
mgnify:CR=1 FL=1